MHHLVCPLRLEHLSMQGEQRLQVWEPGSSCRAQPRTEAFPGAKSGSCSCQFRILHASCAVS